MKFRSSAALVLAAGGLVAAPTANAATVGTPATCVRIFPGVPSLPVTADQFAPGAALTFKDRDEAEDIVIATLSDMQQAVIVKAANNSAMVTYALGKHPAKLAEISKITDPIELAAAIARLEGKLTVTKRNGPPEPERIARGSASVDASATDKTLERLEKEAERTGNSSKLVAYRAQMKARAR